MALSPANSHGDGYPLGLTGATAATRYVGATTSGAPASGTFLVGDFTIDQTGKVYVCTVAGSPGTWSAVAGGGTTVVASASVTSPVSVTSGTEATPTSVISLGAATYTAVPTFITAYFPNIGPAAAAGWGCIFELYDGATYLARCGDVRGPADTTNMTATISYFLTPTAASHTYQIQAFKTGGAGGTNITLAAGTGTGGSGTYLPIQMKATI